MKSSTNFTNYSNKTNLDNYNPHNQNQGINSPRSLKACSRLGINPKNLYIPEEKVLTQDYLSQKQSAPNLTFEQFKNYNEIRRQKKVEMVQQMREQVGREMKQQEYMRSTGNLPKSNMEQNQRLEKENHHFQQREQIMIEKIKNRQKKEIAQMLNGEFKIQAIKDKAEEKQQKMEQKAEMRERMFELQRQQALVKKQEMIEKLKYKEKLDKEKIKVLEKKAAVKEKAFQSLLLEKELQRKGVIESRDGIRHQKKIKLRLQVKAFQRQKEINFKIKREEIVKKDHQRQILIHSAYVRRKEENEEKRLEYEQKLHQVRYFIKF